MERWLNTRGALVTAWSIIGVMMLTTAGFALYLILPAARGAAGGDDRDPARLRRVTVAPVAAATRPAGRTQFSGTVERIEGQVLIVTVAGGDPLRVLVRRGAPVGRAARVALADIQKGEPASVSYTDRSDGRMIGTRIRLQPLDLSPPAPSNDPRPGGSTTNIKTVTGTVVGLDGTRLRLATAAGERVIEMNADAPVTRFVTVSLAELHPGQRVAVEGEYLVDGSLAALSVQVFQ